MKKYFIIFIPFIISIGCFLFYSLIGSKISSNGTLIEPFFLVPIGWFFFFITIISSLLLLIFYIYKKN